MAKKTRVRDAGANPGENPRRPCPCGSGKRYKACHGAGDDVIVPRPFEGLAAECDLVAMREFLPSATAPLPLRDPSEAPVTLATVLPGACAALVRPKGEILLGMQVQTRSGDLSAPEGAAPVQAIADGAQRRTADASQSLRGLQRSTGANSAAEFSAAARASSDSEQPDAADSSTSRRDADA